MLAPTHAYACLIVALCAAERAGTLDGCDDAITQAEYWIGSLERRVHREHDRRAAAQAAIRHTLRPMLTVHAPRNVLLAEAHNANADADAPLTEPEVEDVVAEEVYWTLRRRKRR